MDKFRINNNGSEIEFNIDKIKIFFGNNFQKKFDIYQLLKKNSNDKKISEYDIENNNKVDIYLNDIELNSYNIYDVSYNYNFENDTKLTSKSIASKYLEKKLNNIEFDDIFNSLVNLFECFNDEILSNFSIEDDNLKFKYSINDFNSKSLIKLIDYNIYKDDYIIDYNSLSYEEIILYQLKMIFNINNECKNNSIIFIFSPLTRKIYNYIKENIPSNFYCLIMSNYICDDFSNYVLMNHIMLDLSFQEEIYNYLSNKLNFYFDREDMMVLIKEYIYGISNNRTKELNNII